MPATNEKIEVGDRAGYIGGSDAPALLGLSPWSTPLQVFADKVGSGIRQPYDEQRERLFFFGHALEEAIGKGVEKFYGMPVERSAPFWRAKTRPFMGGHIDFLMSKERAFLECKNVRFAGEKWGAPVALDEDASGRIPPYYVPQVDHYMYVLDFDYCYVAVLIGGNELRVYRVFRDAGREAVLLRAEDEMWERIQSDDPPMGKTYDDFCLAMQLGYIKELKSKQARKQDAHLLTPEQTELVHKLAKAKGAESRAKSAIKILRKEFVESLQGKLGIFCDMHGEELGSLLTGSRTSLDTGLLQAEMPEVYKQFLVKKIFPRLTIEGAEDDD